VQSTEATLFMKLTSPTTAETRNLTQSIGVNPGFFFSGC
jgi:hypothetical protein